MFGYLWNAFYFILALGVLVTIHEYGHFWVARRLGVKVLTFSVGFGKPIWQRRAKDGVNYVIAAIPLGGYVKMLDEREAEVAPTDVASAFNRQPVWARMAIAAAGPIANFILAIVLFWWMFALGITGYSTEVGSVTPNSIAAKAGLNNGDKILAVDGETVYLMQDFVKALAGRIGDTNRLNISVVSEGTDTPRSLSFDLKHWKLDTASADLLGSLGVRHKSRSEYLPPEIEFIDERGAAAKSGLRVGDQVVAFDGEPINNWMQLVKLIHPNAGKQIQLQINRRGELRDISVVIGTHEDNGSRIGRLGISAKGYFATRQAGMIESFGLAVDETYRMIVLSAKLFGKLLTGDISFKSLSGPLSIAEGAGNSARAGIAIFIGFVAMISVNLGFINLLPIPMLDGGHLLFYSIEAIKGKPLTEKVQELGLQIGMMMVVTLMSIAIFNDFSSFFSAFTK